MASLMNVLDRKELPVVYQLGPNLFIATFWLMKLCVARQMIEEALRNGQIGPGGIVVESTSGTMGYALALMARAFGLRVILVGDPALDAALRNLLEALGAQTVVVTEKLPVGGYQIPRLRRLQRVLDINPTAWWPQQYHNPAVRRGFARPARVIASAVSQVDILVSTTGSGGNISGLKQELLALGHRVHSVAVDTHRSVLFGLEDGSRLLRGLGNSIIPENLRYNLIDSVHWVEAADAFCATRMLFTQFGLDMGPTTGAAFMVARYMAAQNPNKAVVLVGPDRAERYLTSCYDRSFCAAHGALTDDLPDAPYTVQHPREVNGGWARMAWNGRSINDVCVPLAKGA